MKKVAFVCPFNLERLTGTPIRAKTTMESVAKFATVSAIATNGIHFNPAVKLEVVGAGKLKRFTVNVLKNLRKIKPEIVHGFTTASIIPMLGYKVFYNWKVKVIFEMHGWTWYETREVLPVSKRLIFWLLDWLGLIFANKIIAMSHTEEAFLKKRLINKNKIAVLWGPADFSINFQPIPERGYLQVGYIGNSSWWQGLSYLLEAAKLLADEPQIKFALAGFDANDSGKFPRLNNMEYIGRVKRDQVPLFIQSCDLMVSPRVKNEVSDLQYPQKLSEYLGGGRMVIVSDTSDQRRVVEEASCGQVLALLGSTALSEAIRATADTSLNERNQLGQRAAIYAQKNFSLEVFKSKLEAVYRGL